MKYDVLMGGLDLVVASGELTEGTVDFSTLLAEQDTKLVPSASYLIRIYQVGEQSTMKRVATKDFHVLN